MEVNNNLWREWVEYYQCIRFLVISSARLNFDWLATVTNSQYVMMMMETDYLSLQVLEIVMLQSESLSRNTANWINSRGSFVTFIWLIPVEV